MRHGSCAYNSNLRLRVRVCMDDQSGFVCSAHLMSYHDEGGFDPIHFIMTSFGVSIK